MAAIIPILINIILAAAVSYVVGLVVSSLTGGPRAPAVSSSGQSSAPDFVSALATSFDPVAPMPGLFGTRRIGGTVVFAQKSGSTTYLIYLLVGRPVQSINGVFINNVRATIDGNGWVRDAPWAKSATSSSMKVTLYNGTQTATNATLRATFPEWGAGNIGKFLTYALIEVTPAPISDYQAAYQQGMPDMTFDVSGMVCYDPRDPSHVMTNPATWTATSSNPATQAANYIFNELGMALPITMIDWDSVVVDANVCDQIVTTTYGSEPRYRSTAFWKTNTKHETVLSEIGATCAGGVIPNAGKFKTWSGYFPGAASATFTEEDYLEDGLVFSDLVSIEHKVNGVRVSFSSPVDNWEERSAPPIQSAALVALDGREIWGEIKLPYCFSASQAQRLARISLLVSRYGTTAEITSRIDRIDTIAGDIVAVTDPLAGFNAKTFRVVRNELGGDMKLKFMLRAEDASFYAWDAATEETTYASYFTTSSTKLTPIPAPGMSVNFATNSRVYITCAVNENGIIGSSQVPITAVDIYNVTTADTVYLGRIPTSSGTTVSVDTGITAAGTYDLQAVFVSDVRTGPASRINVTVTRVGSVMGGSAVVPPGPAISAALTTNTINPLNLFMRLTAVADPSVVNVELFKSTTSDIATATHYTTVSNSTSLVAVGAESEPNVFVWARSIASSGAVSAWTGPAQR